MVVNEGIPYYEPGSRLSCRATTAKVIGKRFVALTATKDPGSRGLEADPGGTGGNIHVTPAGANDAKAFGVATYDAEVGSLTTVVRGGFVVPVTAGSAINANDLIEVGANGKAVPNSTGIVRGIALMAAAVDQDCPIALRNL